MGNIEGEPARPSVSELRRDKSVGNHLVRLSAGVLAAISAGCFTITEDPIATGPDDVNPPVAAANPDPTPTQPTKPTSAPTSTPSAQPTPPPATPQKHSHPGVAQATARAVLKKLRARGGGIWRLNSGHNAQKRAIKNINSELASLKTKLARLKKAPAKGAGNQADRITDLERNILALQTGLKSIQNVGDQDSRVDDLTTELDAQRTLLAELKEAIEDRISSLERRRPTATRNRIIGMPGGE